MDPEDQLTIILSDTSVDKTALPARKIHVVAISRIGPAFLVFAPSVEPPWEYSQFFGFFCRLRYHMAVLPISIVVRFANDLVLIHRRKPSAEAAA